MTSPIVTLRAGASEVAVAPHVGGSIAWYRTLVGDRIIDWLRPADAAGIAARDPGQMGCYPLVPYSNRIRDGRFRFNGRSIALPSPAGRAHALHGHGWRTEWQIVEHRGPLLAVEYQHSADAWPFPYRARQTIRLEPQRLTVTIAATNLGAEPMPVGIGLHPYFPRAAGTRLTAEVREMWETDDQVLPTALSPPPSEWGVNQALLVDQVAMDNGFTGWARHCRIDWPEERASLVMEAEAPLDFLVVYTPPGKPFFCAEPVSNCTDAFNLADQGRGDTGMIVLESEKSVAAAVTFVPGLAG